MAAKDLRKKLGLELIRLRKKKRLSQSDMATQMGIHRNSLARYEQGLAGLSVEMLHHISLALGTTPMAILRKVIPKQPRPAMAAKVDKRQMDFFATVDS